MTTKADGGVAMQVAKKKTAVKKKTVAKKKAAVKKAVKPVDMIIDTSFELENLTKDKAFSLVGELCDNVDFTYFKLGGVLSVIQMNDWFVDEGYENFRTFVETEYGIGYRKALYMVDIYNGLVESGVEWEKVKGLGWTKLKELASILTLENVDDWVSKALEMTVLQLQEYIAEMQKSQTGDLDKGAEFDEEEETASAKKSTTMTFKVHEDQKEIIREAIDRGKEEANTEYDSVALEAVCMNYLAGGSAKKAPTDLKTIMKGSTWEEVLEIFEDVWPDVSLTVEVE